MLNVTKEQLIQEVEDLVRLNQNAIDAANSLAETQVLVNTRNTEANALIADAEKQAKDMIDWASEQLSAAKIANAIAVGRLSDQVKYLQALITGEAAGDDPTPQQLTLPIDDLEPEVLPEESPNAIRSSLDDI